MSISTFNGDRSLRNVSRSIQVRSAFPEDQEDDLLTFVAYSPQLGTRLKISHTQLNIVALAGNGAGSQAIQRLLADAFQSGLIALVRYGDELWILAVLAYSLRVVLYSF